MEEKEEQMKTTNRSPSPISKRLNMNANNINNHSTNSKFFFSTVKKRNNKNDYTIESSKSKIYFNDETKNFQNIATKVRIQNNIIEEYQKWINILMSAINDKKTDSVYNDIGTPIQEGLEEIEKLKSKNFEIKYMIIKKKIQNENNEKQLEKKKKNSKYVDKRIQ